MLIDDIFRAPYHEYLKEVIEQMVEKAALTNTDEIILHINDFKNSQKRKDMVEGGEYYRHKMDIDNKKREITVTDQNNQKLKHNFVKKLVDQKIGYLLSNEPTIVTEKEEFAEMLNEAFDFNMLKKLKSVSREAVNKGIAYWHPYIDENGKLQFTRFNSENVIVFWKDVQKLYASSFIHFFSEERFINGQKKVVECVEIYDEQGISYFLLEHNQLVLDNARGIDQSFHFLYNEQPMLWDRIPLIPFRYNEFEEPLLASVKSIVDNYNRVASTQADMLLDLPNLIFKLKNYGGADLAEFNEGLRRFRAIKVDADGDVDTISANLQTDAVEKELERQRNAIYEFGRGVDTSEDDSLGNASGVALRFRYSDLDLDCNDFENELQSSLEQVFWFMSHYLLLITGQDFTEETVSLKFMRSVITNETEIVTMAKDSVGILDDQTIRENHPWYHDDVENRLEAQQAEEAKRIQEYTDMYKDKPPNSEEIEDE